MTPELKPCPFCGGGNLSDEEGSVRVRNHRRIACEDCCVDAPHEQWNRRTPDLTEALARLKALEEECRAQHFNEPGTPMWHRALVCEWADEIAAISSLLTKGER